MNRDDLIDCVECFLRNHFTGTEFRGKATTLVAEYESRLRANVFAEVRAKITKITEEYIEKYGADIIELYADVVTEFGAWLAEQIIEKGIFWNS